MENQFSQVADIWLLLGKIAHISLSPHAKLTAGVGGRERTEGRRDERRTDGRNVRLGKMEEEKNWEKKERGDCYGTTDGGREEIIHVMYALVRPIPSMAVLVS